MAESKVVHGRIEVNSERCKGCALCVRFCPPQVLRISERRNSLNHMVMEMANEAACTGCRVCADVCPDLAIPIVYQWDEPAVATPSR